MSGNQPTPRTADDILVTDPAAAMARARDFTRKILAVPKSKIPKHVPKHRPKKRRAN